MNYELIDTGYRDTKIQDMEMQEKIREISGISLIRDSDKEKKGSGFCRIPYYFYLLIS